VKFRVEYIFTSERPVSLIARQLGAGDFSLTTSPRLGGVPIQRTLSQPRAQNPDGTPDFSVFLFTLTDARNVKEFYVGQIIELEP
jgi:hypothetical protein